MAAPKGNVFWKLRTRHGREKLFSDPKILWKEACKYFQWCDENPLNTVEQTKGRRIVKKQEITDEEPESEPESEPEAENEDTGLIKIPLMRAYTWEGLELYLGLESLREYKTNPEYEDFSQVIGHIGKIIYTQKFTGAASGLLNANIIARDLGLSDKQELTGKDGQDLFHNVSDDKAKELAQKLKGSSD